jgi:hypothetical protein
MAPLATCRPTVGVLKQAVQCASLVAHYASEPFTVPDIRIDLVIDTRIKADAKNDHIDLVARWESHVRS